MKIYTGKPASPGIAIGRVFLFKSQIATIKTYSIVDPAAEYKRLEDALDKVKADLDKLVEKLKLDGLVEEAGIFQAHIAILEDPELLDATKALIEKKKVNAEAALTETSSTFIEMLKALED